MVPWSGCGRSGVSYLVDNEGAAGIHKACNAFIDSGQSRRYKYTKQDHEAELRSLPNEWLNGDSRYFGNTCDQAPLPGRVFQ